MFHVQIRPDAQRATGAPRQIWPDGALSSFFGGVIRLAGVGTATDLSCASGARRLVID